MDIGKDLQRAYDDGYAQAIADIKLAHKPQTNADRIRSMSDEELAVWLRNIRYSWTCVPRDNGNRCSNFNDDCNACWLDWLKQECE